MMTDAELQDAIVGVVCKRLVSFQRAREIVLAREAKRNSVVVPPTPTPSSGQRSDAPVTPGSQARDIHEAGRPDDVRDARRGMAEDEGRRGDQAPRGMGAHAPKAEAVRADAPREGLCETPRVAAATPGRQRRQVASIGELQARERDVAPVVKLVPMPTVAALFRDKPMGCLFMKAEDPSDFAFRCGKPTKPGQPWCDHHRGIVFNSYGAPWTAKSIARAASAFRDR